MYNTTVPNIREYFLESTSGNTSGIITDEDITVTYFFKPYGVYAKYYDTDNDGEGDFLLLNPTPEFTYSGTLINDFFNQDNNEYQLKNQNNKPMWEEVLSNTKKVKVLNEIKPKEFTSYWFFMGENINEIEDVQKINTSQVKYMQSMFSNCKNLTNINVTSLDTKNVISMVDMFYNCNKLQNIDVSNFDTSNVTSMWAMFGNCNNLESIDVSNFDTRKVTKMGMMFLSCHKLKTLNLQNFDTSNIVDINSMFCWCSNLETINLQGFNTSNVIEMEDLFSRCSKIQRIDLSSFNTKKTKKMKGMFYCCSNLTTIIVGNEWKTEQVESSDIMFSNDCNLIGGKGTTYQWNKTDKEYARIDEGETKPRILNFKRKFGRICKH